MYDQYFNSSHEVSKPVSKISSVHIKMPCNNVQAWKCPKNIEHKWMYDHMALYKNQGIETGPLDISPKRYPVIAKPIYAFKKPCHGGIIVQTKKELKQMNNLTGYFWHDPIDMSKYEMDIILFRGEPKYVVCFERKHKGKVVYYQSIPKFQIPNKIEKWIRKHFQYENAKNDNHNIYDNPYDNLLQDQNNTSKDNSYTGCIHLELTEKNFIKDISLYPKLITKINPKIKEITKIVYHPEIRDTQLRRLLEKLHYYTKSKIYRTQIESKIKFVKINKNHIKSVLRNHRNTNCYKKEIFHKNLDALFSIRKQILYKAEYQFYYYQIMVLSTILIVLWAILFKKRFE